MQYYEYITLFLPHLFVSLQIKFLMPSTAAMGTLADEASKLLDFNQKLDINLLDSIVTCMYTGDGQRVGI